MMRYTAVITPGAMASAPAILQESVAFVRHIDEASGCMYAPPEVLVAHRIPQGVGRQAYRS